MSSCKPVFTLIRDSRKLHRDRGSTAYEDQQTPTAANQSSKKCESKNLIPNYRSVMKKILQEELDEQIGNKAHTLEIIKLLESLESQTSIKMIRDILSVRWFRQLMRRCKTNGVFVRYILQSDMSVENKSYCLKYINNLYNAFVEPRRLKRWIQFKPDRRARNSKIGSATGYDSSSEEDLESNINEQISSTVDIDPLLDSSFEIDFSSSKEREGYISDQLNNKGEQSMEQFPQEIYEDDSDFDKPICIGSKGLRIKSINPNFPFINQND